MSETISISEFKAMNSGKDIKRYQKQKKSDQNKALQILMKRQEAPQLSEMKLLLKLSGIPFESEYIFHPTRKWRFDIALVEHKIAIEYEGIFSEKSGHTTIKGFLQDIDKYNSATLLGWRLLRYTTKNYKHLIPDLRQIL